LLTSWRPDLLRELVAARVQGLEPARAAELVLVQAPVQAGELVQVLDLVQRPERVQEGDPGAD
jgi:hypothetical protein